MVKKHKKLSDLVDVVKRLRNPKNGCPWDIQQTSKSLAKYTLEEAYEVIEAIESNNYRELVERLETCYSKLFIIQLLRLKKRNFLLKMLLIQVSKK